MDRPTILYVDDEPDALSSMSTGLADRGYSVLTASSGEEALDILKTQQPDLVIADLRMQPMNGFELYQHVKKEARFAATPFFFLTAVDDFLAQKYGQTLGVDAYIVKPVDLEHLVKMIEGKLHRS